MRGVLLGALAYFVMPIDIIPDVFAMVGFSDDIAVLTAAFAMVSGQIRPGTTKRPTAFSPTGRKNMKTI